MENHQIIHKHTYNPFKAWHLLAIFIPSVVFFSTIYFFSGKSEVKNSAAAIEIATPEPKVTIQIGETKILAQKSDSEIERRIGLSNHLYLPADEGMLFVMNNYFQHQFWMKDMKFPIDIIWIKDNTIMQIHSGVQPEPGKDDRQLTFYIPNDEVNYVLEVNAGFTEKNNIRAGDEVKFDIF